MTQKTKFGLKKSGMAIQGRTSIVFAVRDSFSLGIVINYLEKNKCCINPAWIRCRFGHYYFDICSVRGEHSIEALLQLAKSLEEKFDAIIQGINIDWNEVDYELLKKMNEDGSRTA